MIKQVAQPDDQQQSQRGLQVLVAVPPRAPAAARQVRQVQWPHKGDDGVASGKDQRRDAAHAKVVQHRVPRDLELLRGTGDEPRRESQHAGRREERQEP